MTGIILDEVQAIQQTTVPVTIKLFQGWEGGDIEQICIMKSDAM